MDHEKSILTNQNMTFFAFAKAEAIAFDVSTSPKKWGNDQYFDFRGIERINKYACHKRLQFCTPGNPEGFTIQG